MMRRFCHFLIFLLWWSGIPVLGQSAFRFKNPETTKIKMPFTVSQNLIIIPVKINQSTDLKMVFDSGISNTIITELTEADSITLIAARTIKVGGLGDGTPIEALYSSNNVIELIHPDDSTLAITGTAMDIYVLTTDQFELSRQLGIRINGLVGSDLFENFVISIDPVSREVTFHNRANFNFRKYTRSYSGIPLTILNGKAYTELKMLQENDSLVTVKLLIDTGASLSFWIAPVADSKIVVPEKTVRSLLGQGLNGIITGANGRVKNAEWGPFTFKRPLISYPDSASVSGLTLNTERHGSLGNDILRRFTVIFDFGGSMLYLKPNKWFRAPFSYNRSGMDVEKMNPLVPVFSIFSVIPESPADRAGVKPGDVIEYINYLPAFNLNLDDITNILYGETGSLIILRVNRDGTKLKFKFHLEDKI